MDARKYQRLRYCRATHQALKDEDENVKWLAVTALGDIGDERVLEPINMVPTGNDEFLKEMVTEALQNIRSRY